MLCVAVEAKGLLRDVPSSASLLRQSRACHERGAPRGALLQTRCRLRVPLTEGNRSLNLTRRMLSPMKGSDAPCGDCAAAAGEARAAAPPDSGPTRPKPRLSWR